MDAATAEALIESVEVGSAGMRRRQPDAARGIEQRYPDSMQALGWLAEQGDLDAAFRLASALVPFWMATNRIEEGDLALSRLLALPGETDARRARALHDHGYLMFWSGRYALAVERFTASMVQAAALGDDNLRALALAGLARVALDTDVDEAIRLLREAIGATDGRDDREEGRSSALHVLGVALQMRGDLEGARRVMSARLAAGQRSGDTFVASVEAANLSMVERQLGNLDRAEELARQALAFGVDRGDQLFIAWTLNGLAAVTAAEGRLERAAILNGIADAQLERAGGQWPPDEQKQYDDTRAVLEAGLTQDAIRQARSRGAAMTPADAIAYALAD